MEHARVVAEFKNALDSGDLSALIALLDPSATVIADGGGVVAASLERIEGAETIARYFLALHERQPDLNFQLTSVNGQVGLVGQDAAGTALAVASVAITQGRIEQIWVIRNPEKLAGWV